MSKLPPVTSDYKRLFGLAIFLFLLFSLLISQFYRIQIVEGDKWSLEAHRQHFFVVKEPFLRGTFYSNTSIKKGHPETLQKLVFDIQKFHLYIDPVAIPPKNRKQIAENLQSVLNLTVAEKLSFKSNFVKKSRSRKLAMWLDVETRDVIQAWWLPYAKKYKIPRNAVFFVTDYQRSYPFGKLLGQVIHTVQNNKDEVTKQALPTGGLELTFNDYLKGKQGKRRLMRSPRNAFETGEIISSPEHGADIHLTINHCLQAIAEEEIEKGVKKAKAKAGWAVMMNPHNGEILAIAQYPSFFPPDYQSYFNDPKLIENTKVKAITDANEPGSVMKPFTMLAALLANEVLVARGEKPLFDPEAKMVTNNSKFPGRSKPLTSTHTHNFLNMDLALQKSCNVYVARLAEAMVARLGKEWYRAVLYDSFGFGKKTGLELPGESNGVLPMPGKKHPNGKFEWSGSTPYSLAMGHNIQATSLQLVRAYAILANGGYLVKPTLLRKITKTRSDGTVEVIKDNTNHERGQRVLDSKNVERLIVALKSVTKTGGTSARANIWGYTEAGKTGTAEKVVNGQYSKQLYASTFVGFTPVRNSAFVLLVAMDELEYNYIPGIGKMHHGGTCCAPVFREIATRALDYLGITPDDPHGYPPGDPRYDAEKADWVPEIRKLQELYNLWNNSGSH
jgi:cell division protein FtsI (penicillin-binding protein 3)